MGKELAESEHIRKIFTATMLMKMNSSMWVAYQDMIVVGNSCNYPVISHDCDTTCFCCSLFTVVLCTGAQSSITVYYHYIFLVVLVYLMVIFHPVESPCSCWLFPAAALDSLLHYVYIHVPVHSPCQKVTTSNRKYSPGSEVSHPSHENRNFVDKELMMSKQITV